MLTDTHAHALFIPLSPQVLSPPEISVHLSLPVLWSFHFTEQSTHVNRQAFKHRPPTPHSTTTSYLLEELTSPRLLPSNLFLFFSISLYFNGSQ